MQNFNLAACRIWSFADETGDSIRLSLPEVLMTDIPLNHAPCFGFLASLQHELLASILQVVIDTLWQKGIKKKEYLRLLSSDNIKRNSPLVRQICDELNIINGFSLFGKGAFLQMPSAWKNSGGKIQIARLMWPFIPNIHRISTAKGIRRMAPIPVKLRPDLTALFLFASCSLPKGGLRYWTIGNLAGRALLHANYGKTLRQQLFSAILPGYSPHWKRLQPLPWVVDCLNNGGLKADGKPPFLPYITGRKTLNGTANTRFFQARAIILDPPELGVCDVSGEHTQVFTTYRLLEDRVVHKLILKCSWSKKKINAANILGAMFAKNKHPSVAADRIDLKKDDKKNRFTLSYHGYSLPSWAIFGKTCLFPSHTIQSHDPVINSHLRVNDSNWSFFQLKYASKQQDVKGVFQYSLPGRLAFDVKKREQIKFLAEITEESIQQLRSGMRLLCSSQNNNQKQKNNAKELIDHFLLNISQQLWNKADTLFYNLLSTNQEAEVWKKEINFCFQKETYNCWHRFLEDDWASRPLSFQNYYREHKATCIALGENSMDADRSYLEANPAVRAGRAFVEAYQELSSQEKSQLLNETVPYISEYFWICMRKAKKEDPSAYQQIYEQVLPLLIYIKPVTDGKNIGRILAKHKQYIKSRRMELLFTEEDRDILLDTLLQLFYLITSKCSRPLFVDFGVLLLDLNQFYFQPSTVIRRWATDYFSYVATDQKEEENVQA